MRDALKIDPEREAARIAAALRDFMRHRLRRRGLVVGLSGGIDSSVTAGLAVQALGATRVLGLTMPERHSDPETLRLGNLSANSLGIGTAHEDITGTLEALGFYRRYDAAIRSVIPEYGPGWKSKLIGSGIPENRGFSFFSIAAQSPDGEMTKKRLPLKAYLEIVSATNFKQRTRKMFEYYHADRRHYAVAGTPNRLEHDQGFFVKQGDGAADVKPIAHLYKSQVYQLAEYLGIPEEIRRRPPTTDTYSLPQGQEEFYFGIPYEQMDLCLYGKDNHIDSEQVAAATGLTRGQVEAVFQDIENKRAATRYLHLEPLLVPEQRAAEVSSG